MQRTHIAEISLESKEAIRICGFVERTRVLKNIAFLIIRDATGKVQVTIDPAVEEQQALYEQIKTLTAESVVEFEGVIQANTSVKFRGMELIPSKLVIHSTAEENKPIDEKTNSSDRMDWRFLDLRSPRNLLIFKVQTAIEAAMREFWLMRKFIEIHSPKFMASPSESKAELFEVKYFEGVAYLAQSPQFYKQMAMAAGFERVFEIGPVFRANPSHTVRHDTEFTSVDSEMSFIDSHEDIMQFEEQWIAYVLKRVKEQYGEEIQKEFGVDIIVPALPFPRITMAEAQEQLRKESYTCERVGDLDPEGERRVCAYTKKELGHEFVFCD